MRIDKKRPECVCLSGYAGVVGLKTFCIRIQIPYFLKALKFSEIGNGCDGY